jgi:Preprotein translocase subunit SecA (ATPase, RNA helicase)
VTPQGVEKVERALRIDNLYAPENTQLVNHLYQALKAESLYHLDIEYVIQDGEVKIVDEFTGRIMEGAAGARASTRRSRRRRASRSRRSTRRSPRSRSRTTSASTRSSPA